MARRPTRRKPNVVPLAAVVRNPGARVVVAEVDADPEVVRDKAATPALEAAVARAPVAVVAPTGANRQAAGEEVKPRLDDVLKCAVY